MSKLTRKQALQQIEELRQYINELPEGDTVDQWLEQIGKNEDAIAVIRKPGRLYLTLPCCNTEWTLEVWRIATELIKLSNGNLYINHGEEPKDLGNVVEIRSSEDTLL